MLGFQLFIAGPTTWTRVSRGGVAVREGVGLTTLRFRPLSTLVAIPLDVRETSFRVQETAEGLAGSGRVVWRISDPESAAARLDFRVDRNGDVAGNGLEKLDEFVRAERAVAFRRMAKRSEEIPSTSGAAAEAFVDLRASSLLASLGVEVLAIHVDVVRVVKGGAVPEPCPPPAPKRFRRRYAAGTDRPGFGEALTSVRRRWESEARTFHPRTPWDPPSSAGPASWAFGLFAVVAWFVFRVLSGLAGV